MSASPIVLDTHALLWWCLDPTRLSPAAAASCAEIEARGGGLVCSISMWELGVKIRNRKLDIGMTIQAFADRVASLGVVEILPVDTDLWLANLALDWPHRDPADRTIVALASSYAAPLVTKDAAIRDFYSACVW